MTFTVNPQPANEPPRVRFDVDVDVDGGAFTELVITRDGRRIREQPAVGSAVAAGFDYEAPFGVPITYQASGAYLPPVEPDWTETWANLNDWTGTGFSVSGGKARSSATDAQIVRDAAGAIQRINVTDPNYVRVELLNDVDAVVASVEVGATVVVAGTSTTSTSGSGSFCASLANGVIAVTSSNGTWAASRAYEGAPTKVRVVSLGVSYSAGPPFSTTGYGDGIAVDAAGNIYITDQAASMVRKFDPAGVQTKTIPTVDPPLGVAVDGSGNIYVSLTTGGRVQKFSPSGARLDQIGTDGANNRGIAVDTDGYLYVTDLEGRVVRKFNPTNTGFTVIDVDSGEGTATDRVAVDAAGNVYIYTLGTIRKYGPTGAYLANFPIAGLVYGLAVDSSGNLYVSTSSNNSSRIRKLSATGVDILAITDSRAGAIAIDAEGNVYAADVFSRTARKHSSITPSVGAIVETPVVVPQMFSASATTTLDVTDAWLIHPSRPSLSCMIQSGSRDAGDTRFIEASSGETKTSAAQATVHRPIGRKKAVVYPSGPRQADEWTLVIGAPTIALKNAIRALVDDQSPLLLRTPPEMVIDLPDDWYSVGDVPTLRQEKPVVSGKHLISLPVTPVDEPVVRQGALWTWGDVLMEYATWADVLADNETWLNVLVGPNS